MPRLKPTSGPAGDVQPPSGPSNQVHVRRGKLYLVKVDPPGVVRLAEAVRTDSHPLTGRLQVYVSFPGLDKRHDQTIDGGAVLEAYNPASVQLDAEGILLRRMAGADVQGEEEGMAELPVQGDQTQTRAAEGNRDGALSVGTPMVQVSLASPNQTKRRRLNQAGAQTPSANHLDPAAAGLLNSLHTPNSRTDTPDREHAAMTRVRNFDHVRFSQYLIKTWYFSPYIFPVDENVPFTQTPQSNGPTTKLEKHAGATRVTSTAAPLATAIPGTSKKRGRDSLLSSNGHALAGSPGPSSSSGAVQTPTGNGHSNGAIGGERPKVKSVSEMLGGASGKRSGGGGVVGERLFVCYKCFKYTRELQKYRAHDAACTLFKPPGRLVYQRDTSQFTIWEVDGALAPLYCQNLSLFGKLFIDHKSVFFHVENFVFYVACIRQTSTYEQATAFFSKEKVSYDDYNLACIVTFPPWQKRYQLGRLLIEFSYLLTRHPATRSPTLSPGTPERPISDLGMKGYSAYWRSTVLRYLRNGYRSLHSALATTSSPPTPSTALRREGENADPAVATLDMTIKQLARAVHLTEDDTIWAMMDMGLVRRRSRGRKGEVGVSSDGERGEVRLTGDAAPLASAALLPVQETKDAVLSAMAGPATDAGTISGSVPMANGVSLASGRGGDVDDGDDDDSDYDDDDYDDGHENQAGATDKRRSRQRRSRWIFDMSKSKIDALCAQYRVAEEPVLVESAVKL